LKRITQKKIKMAQISLKSLMNNSAPTYPAEVAQPFRDELTGANFLELLTPAGVDAALGRQDNKVVLVLLNSVCGCAARGARPGTIFSLLNEVIPDEFTTVFAGMEKEAVDHFRAKYLPGVTPSSPNIALFRNGEPVFLMQRYQIEGRSAGEIAQQLAEKYDELCSRKNSPGEFDTLKNYIEHKYQVRI
jgi:putative YphP/YqiW family bacilliredoxin